jgi:hypothetical protein
MATNDRELVSFPRAWLLFSVVGLWALVAGCGPGPHIVASPTTLGGMTSLAPPFPGLATTITTTTTPATATTTTVDPGLLPQTLDEPALGAELDGRMGMLWEAIVTNRVDAALALFFPESAYLTMKTGVLPNPAADYANRLIAFYRADVGVYHALLGPDAASATLVAVSVASADAAWIPPGRCENRVGYWHLPGVRLVYQVGGVVRSVGVDSLISWHDEWYVVHLGPNPRPSGGGVVDRPALGAGVPGPPGGC